MARNEILSYYDKVCELVKTPYKTNEASFHSVVHWLIESVARKSGCGALEVIHEPRALPHSPSRSHPRAHSRETARNETDDETPAAVGRPDFIILRGSVITGYIEVEAHNVSLDALRGHANAQVARFIENLDNLLLTNCWDFRLYRGGVEVLRASLPDPRAPRKPTDKEIELLETLLQSFLTWEMGTIRSEEELAKLLARRARQLREIVLASLCAHDCTKHELCGFRQTFKESLLPDLDNHTFADIFAQTVTYGLFAARCEKQDDAQPFTRKNALSFIKQRDLASLLMRFIGERVDLYCPQIVWILDDIAQLLNNTDVNAAMQKSQQEFGKTDPVLHFYETFLANYDPTLREIRGVYYTPEQVVDFIVRSVDVLLKRCFGMEDGLADGRAFVLDPACGTGTFLARIIKLVYDTVCARRGKGAWHGYVRDELLPRLFGIELLVAPFIIAHIKLSYLLRATGYKFKQDERIGVYLANTLDFNENWRYTSDTHPFIREAEAAAKVKKEKPILVVIGNPPYSVESANKNYIVENGKRRLTFIGELIEDYKFVDGQPINERYIRPLQDDYVKFIRFAQWRIEQTGKGIIGYITNHCWLDNITFRGMRWNLLRAFDEIYILNLHGNKRKRETPPDGGVDENVFHIQQGVAIVLAVRRGDRAGAQPCKVYYCDLWGKRADKYEFLANNDVSTIEWQELHPQPPLYLFVPIKSAHLQSEYERGFSVTNIFKVYNSCTKTNCDKLTIQFSPYELWETVVEFVNLAPDIARARYKPKESRDWRVQSAQDDLRNAGVPDEKARAHITQILYRPFDIRYTFYTGKTRGFHSYPFFSIMQHMLLGENWGLVTARQQRQIDVGWAAVTVTKCIADHNLVNKGSGSYLFPLYLHGNVGRAADECVVDMQGRLVNFSERFVGALSERLGVRRAARSLPEGITAEEIFGYIYAILHSRKYRERYDEFLRRDFPRVPITSDFRLFKKLAELGVKLVKAHLLIDVPNDLLPKLEGEGDGYVTDVRFEFAGDVGRAYINDTQYFAPIARAVANYNVGAHYPVKDWLVARRGRVLSYDEITHYQRVIAAIAYTLRLVDEIDELIEFPLE